MDIPEDFKCSECNIDLSEISSYLSRDGTMVCEKCAAPYLTSMNTITNRAQEQSFTIVPDGILEKLKCGECLEFLSCGPVHWAKDGTATCGRCGPQDDSAVRNNHYEALAQLMLFPCRYKKNGCPESLPFSDQESEHEKICNYRREPCPVMAPFCQWCGEPEQFLSHCKEKHVDRIVKNPLSLSYNVSVNSIYTFLLKAYSNLFMFHTKVCMEAKMIYYTVQYVGNFEEDISKKFDFTLTILRNNKMIRRDGQVTPLVRYNYNSKLFLRTRINTVANGLDGLDNCVFTITVNKLFQDVAKCGKCKKEISQFLYQDDGKWFCDSCIPEKKVTCKNVGCTHMDLEKKCQKHEIFFCPKTTWCWLCRKLLDHGEFVNHYNLKHSDKTYKEGSPWTAFKTGYYDKIFLYPTDVGNAIIKYRFNDTNFMVLIRTAIPSYQLFEYHCVLKLTVPEDTQKSRIFVLNSLYNEIHDWKLDLKRSDIPKWSETISVVINIRKGSKPKITGVKNVVYQ